MASTALRLSVLRHVLLSGWAVTLDPVGVHWQRSGDTLRWSQVAEIRVSAA